MGKTRMYTMTNTTFEFPAVTVCNQNAWRRSTEEMCHIYGCHEQHLDQIVRFDAFNNSLLRSVVYEQLRRQNYDLRTTFPPTHPTEWLARLFTTNNYNQSNLLVNIDDRQQRVGADFLYDFNETLSEHELRGLWSIFTNESEHLQFVQEIKDEFNRMPFVWRDEANANYGLYK